MSEITSIDLLRGFIKNELKYMSFTHKDLESRSGITESYIAKILRGNIKNVSLKTQDRLIDALGVKRSRFFAYSLKAIKEREGQK